MEVYRTPVLSGTPGAGKTTLAERLNAKYRWPILSAGGLLREMHKQAHPDADLSFEEWYGKFRSKDLVALNAELKRRFEAGGVIGDSRYVANLDHSKCVFIFLDADIRVRASRATANPSPTGYLGMPVEQIVTILQKRENDELKFGKELFNIDYRDHSLYDLVLNTGSMSVDEELDAVEKLMRIEIST